MDPNQFLIELQAKLDEAKSKGNINSDILKIQDQINKLKIKTELDPSSISNLKSQIESILNQRISIRNINIDPTQAARSGQQIGENISQNIANGINRSGARINSEIQKINNQINRIRTLTNGGIKNDYTTQIAKLEGNFRSLGFNQDEIQKKTATVVTAFNNLKTIMSKPFNESNYQEIIALNDKLQKELAESSNEYERLQASSKGFVSVQQRLSKANTIEAWNQKNKNATKEVLNNNEAYISSLRNLNMQMSQMKFNEISDGFKRAENSMRGLGRLGAAFKDQMQKAAQSFTQWLSVSSVIMLLISKTRQAIAELKEVDTIITEISKANEKLSESELKNIGNNSFNVASKYGKKATNYLSGVQEASRAGYENAEEIAELSVAAQGAGDMTDKLANQMIIATDKAYKMNGSVSELTKTLDGINYITNHNAVNMTELSEAMTIVGSTAASFGIAADQTTAAVGTMAATTQQSGSEVARAFRAILLNIRQVSDEEEGIDAEGLTKYEAACNALGVSLKETKDGVLSLRDPMKVLEELSSSYNKLDESDIKRTNLLNSVGGKLRSTQFDALLRNWDMYETMLQQYADGSGSMAVEAEKTANSWEGSLNRLSNTWTATIGNIADSDGITTAINGFNEILSVINILTDKFGALKTIGLGIGIFAGLKNVGGWRNVSPQLFLCFEIADNDMCSLGY